MGPMGIQSQEIRHSSFLPRAALLALVSLVASGCLEPSRRIIRGPMAQIDPGKTSPAPQNFPKSNPSPAPSEVPVAPITISPQATTVLVGGSATFTAAG